MAEGGDIERAIEALRRRVDVLEGENAGLRTTAAPVAPGTAAATGRSRRQVLVGGAGILGALAGGGLLGRAEPTHAAAAPDRAEAVTHLGLRVILTPLRTRGVLWATHEWDLGAHFAGAEPPVVVATAWDDQLERDVAACCTCAVAVRGVPGAYRATIMVRGVSPFATEVLLNAVALGA